MCVCMCTHMCMYYVHPQRTKLSCWVENQGTKQKHMGKNFYWSAAVLAWKESLITSHPYENRGRREHFPPSNLLLKPFTETQFLMQKNLFPVWRRGCPLSPEHLCWLGSLHGWQSIFIKSSHSILSGWRGSATTAQWENSTMTWRTGWANVHSHQELGAITTPQATVVSERLLLCM